jgi:hypothetical protein
MDLIRRLVAGVVVVASLAPAHAARAGDPAVSGRWAAPFWEGGPVPDDAAAVSRYPTAASVVVLPDGRVLYWNGGEGMDDIKTTFITDRHDTFFQNSRARVLDLDGPSWTVPAPERARTAEAQPAVHDIFCSDQKLLYDGTVLIAGGNEARTDGDTYGDDETTIFDPHTDTFGSAQQMARPRWYPSLVTLADGNVLVLSGTEELIVPEPAAANQQVTELEEFDPATRTWQTVGTTPWSLPMYPRVHLLPSGKLFFGGTGHTWGPAGEAPDEATWAVQRLWDPVTRTWTFLGPARYGVRGGGMSVLLRLEPPYDTARILMAGGTLGPAPGSWQATTLSETLRIDGDTVTPEGPRHGPFDGTAGDPTQLRNRRWLSTPVLLPTGEVLAFSGGTSDASLYPGGEQAVRTAELYEPASNTWRALAAGSRDRTYHNTAALLPDGRVLVGGHAPLPAYGTWYGFPVAASNNYRDSTFEIFEPPYLFKGPRPALDTVDVIDGGLRVTGDGIDDLVLVRLPAVTHAVDADMRAVTLALSRDDGGTIEASLPGATVLPPGPYYLFALRGGVPSIARTVLVQPGAAAIV